MAGFNHSFNHFLRTGHFISDNTPVTHSQLKLMLDYIKKNPTFYNSRPPHQSITLVAKPTSDKVSEKDCLICTKSMSMKLEESAKLLEEKLKEADNELEETFKAYEEKIDKLYQSVERLLPCGKSRTPRT